MSDPTYRIDVERRNSADRGAREYPWCATAVRLSDDYMIAVQFGPTAREALEAAALYVREDGKGEKRSYFVDDDGRPVEAHSVKA